MNNGKSFVLLHVEVPSDGGLVIPWLVVATVVTPSVLSYVNLARIYGFKADRLQMIVVAKKITDGGGSLATLPSKKTRITLLFRKKLQPM